MTPDGDYEAKAVEENDGDGDEVYESNDSTESIAYDYDNDLDRHCWDNADEDGIHGMKTFMGIVVGYKSLTNSQPVFGNGGYFNLNLVFLEPTLALVLFYHISVTYLFSLLSLVSRFCRTTFSLLTSGSLISI